MVKKNSPILVDDDVSDLAVAKLISICSYLIIIILYTQLLKIHFNDIAMSCHNSYNVCWAPRLL